MKKYCVDLLKRVPSNTSSKLARLAKEDNMFEKIIQTTHYLENPGFSQRLFDIIMDKTTNSYCDCGKILRFQRFSSGYRQFCSVKCSRMSKSTQDKQKATTLEKYGVENISQSSLIKSKKKATCIKNYGVEYGLQSQLVRDKVIQTNIEKYGVINTYQLPKTRKTLQEKYGVDNIFQNEDIKNKIKEINIIKYGVENPNQSKLIQNKSRKTREENGDWTKLEDLTDFEYYKHEVKLLTEKVYRKNKTILETDNKRTISYQLDHKISIYQGFHNRIPPYIISNIHNLEIISRSNNAQKHTQCSLTFEELYYKVFN